VSDFREYFCGEIEKKLQDLRMTEMEIVNLKNTLSMLNSPEAELERLRGMY